MVLELLAGGRHCGLPLAVVGEVFRPLPVQALGEPVPALLGLVRVRGEALPLLELNPLLGAEPAAAGRFVSLRVDGRGAVLAVDAVLGLRAIEAGALQALPPLLQAAAPAVAAVARLDPALLLVLNAGRLLPTPSPGPAA